MGAWWSQTVGPLLGAIGLIGSAAFAAWATRGKARRDESQQSREDIEREKERAARDVERERARADRLQVQRDALYDYVYDLRGGYHAMNVNPPPWPKHAAAPPWALKETADG